MKSSERERKSRRRQTAVDVIIPVRDRETWIGEAIESALAQTFRDFRLRVVDDGSIDGTPGVLAGFDDERMSVLRLDPPRGVAAARNAAIRASEAPWIALLDSDDLWQPQKLERQMALAETEPDATLIHSDEIWIRDGNRINQGKRHRKSGGDLFRRSLRLVLVSPSSALIRRSILSETGLFNESLPAAEDYDLWLRILCRHPALYIDEPLVVKRGGHADQLSRSIPALDRYRIRALLDLLNQAPLNEDQRTWTIRELSYKCRVYAQGCRKRGREQEAVRIERYAKLY